MADRRDHDDDCGAIRPHLEGFFHERLPEPGAATVRAHLVTCHRCRAHLVSMGDPSAFFLELGSIAPTPQEWSGFMTALRERLAREREGGRRGFWSGMGAALRYPRLAYVAAPLAMVLVLAATLFVLRPGDRGLLVRANRPGAVQSPYQRPLPPTAPPITGRRVPKPEPLTMASGASPEGEPPALEEVEAPGARVYRFDLEGAGGAGPIYLVVDESIEF